MKSQRLAFSIVTAAATISVGVASMPHPVAAQGVLAPVCNLGPLVATAIAGQCPATAPPSAPPASATAPQQPPPAPDPAAVPTNSAAPCSGVAGKEIVIGLQAQHLTACQDSSTFIDTPITTGRHDLPTPTGTFSVLRKNSPWMMRSPWARSSRYWYPPSRVEFALWFTNEGHAIHDASWRTEFGAGTEAQGSHGCVNVPRPAMDQLFGWAELGTPVVIVQ